MLGTDVLSFAEHIIRDIMAKPYAATATETGPGHSSLRWSYSPLYGNSCICLYLQTGCQESSGLVVRHPVSLGIMEVGFPIDYLWQKDSFLIGMSLSTCFVGALLVLILYEHIWK